MFVRCGFIKGPAVPPDRAYRRCAASPRASTSAHLLSQQAASGGGWDGAAFLCADNAPQSVHEICSVVIAELCFYCVLSGAAPLRCTMPGRKVDGEWVDGWEGGFRPGLHCMRHALRRRCESVDAASGTRLVSRCERGVGVCAREELMARNSALLRSVRVAEEQLMLLQHEVPTIPILR